MTQILKKIRVWWLNVQVSMAKREMCEWFARGDLYRAHVAKDRFHALIAKRNALEVQP